METILITGATGFLGSKIVEMLLLKDKKVIALIRETSPLIRLHSVIDHPNLKMVVIEKNNINEYFKKYNIDAIIHTATSYGRNNEIWSEVAEANLILPLQLLSIGEKSGVKCFINADTFFNENIKFEKNEGYYVQTKKSLLNIAKNASASIKIKFINLRIEQMYGPNDNEKKFIPLIVNQLFSNTQNIPMTSGDQRRDFIFVDDVAKAFLYSIENYTELSQFEEFGIGTGASTSIKEIVAYLKKIIGSTSNLNFGQLQYRQNEIMDSNANISKNTKIKWAAKINWKDGLEKTVDFYKKLNNK